MPDGLVQQDRAAALKGAGLSVGRVRIGLGWFGWLLMAWLVAGCASEPRPVLTVPPGAPEPAQRPSAPPAAPRLPKPYAIDGKWYQPLPSAQGYVEQGLASWYGRQFHGRPTANGEPYDMYAVSAAHKTLPLGTWVEVQNLENGRSLDLRINDRGPFVDGRIIDLSYGAARKLGVVEPGTARVKVVALGRRTAVAGPGQAPVYTPMDYDHGNFTFQVGAFREPANAYRLRDRLASAYPNVHITTYFHADHGNLYGVRLGRATTLSEAARFKTQLREAGFEGAFTIAE